MKNNKFPEKIDRHVTPRQRRQRIGAAAVGLGLTTGLIGFAAGAAVGARGMVPEATGTCVGPVTPSEIEGGIGGLQDTLGTDKVTVESKTGASIDSEAAKHIREVVRDATADFGDDNFVPELLKGDRFTAEGVSEGVCAVQPGAQFTVGPDTSRKDI